MTQHEWRAFVTWQRPDTADDAERLSALTLALPGFGIVHDQAAQTARLQAGMTVEAPTIRQASEAALRAARAAHAQAFGTAGEPLQLRVLTLEEHDSEVARPAQMELMGLTEAAAELGISPQRVDQLSRENPQFPAPVARPAAGAIFTADSIRAAKERGWQRRPGRPRATSSAEIEYR